MTAWQEAIRLNKQYNWNVIPMYFMTRDEAGKKHVKMIDWQQYKSEPYNLSNWDENYKALAIITGKISDLTILDIDSEEALSTLLSQTGFSKVTDLASYVVKTTKGYQLFYTYEPNSRTRISIKDKIDFLSGGVTFAHSTNDGYEVIKDQKPTQLPQVIKDLIVDNDLLIDIGTKEFEKALRENSDMPYKNPLRDLVRTFIDSGKIGKNIKKELERVFCTKDYKDYSLEDFARPGQIHNSMLYVAGIVASNPTVNKDLYIDFMEHWAKKVAKIKITPEEQILIQNRIKGGMNYFRYDENWKQKADELSTLKARENANNFKTWYNPEEDLYYFYDLNTKKIDSFSRPSFKEQIARVLYKAGEDINVNDIDTKKIDSVYETFDPTIDDEFFTDERGMNFHNNFRRSTLLAHFLTADPIDEMPKYINHLLTHLIPTKSERDLFLHSLAYHMTYLSPAPTCWIFTSIQGVGKNKLLELLLGEIYSDTYLKTEEASLVGRFRNSLKNKLCVFIDEVKIMNNMNAERGTLYNVLKQIVANKSFQIESKGKDEKSYPNHAFYVLASNDEVPLRISDESDRRINIIASSNTKLEDTTWMPKGLSELELDNLFKSELKDFVAYLASIELDHRKWNTIINNHARQNLLRDSVPAAIRYANALINLDTEMLVELNHDLADFIEGTIIKGNRSYITTKELKEYTGDLAVKIGKKLRAADIIYKPRALNGQTVRTFEINPHGTDKTFHPESL